MRTPPLPDSTAAAGPRASRLALAAAAAGLLLAGGLAGCNLEKLAGSSLPPNIPDPGLTHTAQGAMSMYFGSLIDFRGAVGGDPYSYIPISGMFTDELGSAELGLVGSESSAQLLDSRYFVTGTGNQDVTYLYGLLQRTRNQIGESRGLLEQYDPDSTVLVGTLDLVQGFTEVYLADFFCSGVPLSTVDYNGDFTLKPGSSTQQVYTDAAAEFDSAMALGADSPNIVNAARVGEGRAQLDLGNFAAAAAAVASVPVGFTWAMHYSTATEPLPNGPPLLPDYGNYQARDYAWNDFITNPNFVGLTLSDTEGGNGLAFLSAGDPRTPWVQYGTNNNGYPLYRPATLATSGGTPTGADSIVLAGYIEAQLIEAEAALQAGDTTTWLSKLNALRTNGTATGGVWNAGTGGVAGLAPLSEPGSDSARVSLLFRERGFWLYLTGHRQGDLRRLIRQYGRDPSSVYPTGYYPGAYGEYGSAVTAPVPTEEQQSNPLFTGCISTGA